MPKKNGFMMFVSSRVRESKLQMSIPDAIPKFAPEWERMGPAQREPYIQQAARFNANPKSKLSAPVAKQPYGSRPSGTGQGHANPGEAASATAKGQDLDEFDDWGSGEPAKPKDKDPPVPLANKVANSGEPGDYYSDDDEEEFFTPPVTGNERDNI